ncbi:hypothetical protein Pelo_17131 [Pelomyxa schiedti]|nr:hypothetical protein Pelo_17131 [Pelomyxa schiedti]
MLQHIVCCPDINETRNPLGHVEVAAPQGTKEREIQLPLLRPEPRHDPPPHGQVAGPAHPAQNGALVTLGIATLSLSTSHHISHIITTMGIPAITIGIHWGQYRCQTGIPAPLVPSGPPPSREAGAGLAPQLRGCAQVVDMIATHTEPLLPKLGVTKVRLSTWKMLLREFPQITADIVRAKLMDFVIASPRHIEHTIHTVTGITQGDAIEHCNKHKNEKSTDQSSQKRMDTTNRYVLDNDEVHKVMSISRLVWDHVLAPTIAPQHPHSHDRETRPPSRSKCVWAMAVAEALFPLVPRACRAVLAASGPRASWGGLRSSYFALECAAMAGGGSGGGSSSERERERGSHGVVGRDQRQLLAWVRHHTAKPLGSGRRSGDGAAVVW